MRPNAPETSQILALLAQTPVRIAQLTRDVPSQRLQLRSEAEPWSVSDILAHVRACADSWSSSIRAMLTHDNPTLRYRSPRLLMHKPHYQAIAFEAALAAFTQERQTLMAELAALDEAGWQRRATFTGTSPRQRDQTVLRYAERIISHEQPHLVQIEALLGQGEILTWIQ